MPGHLRVTLLIQNLCALALRHSSRARRRTDSVRRGAAASGLGGFIFLSSTVAVPSAIRVTQRRRVNHSRRAPRAGASYIGIHGRSGPAQLRPTLGLGITVIIFDERNRTPLVVPLLPENPQNTQSIRRDRPTSGTTRPFLGPLPVHQHTLPTVLPLPQRTTFVPSVVAP